MSKAILVVDMPSSCGECEFCLEITENHHCCQRVSDDNERCKRVDYDVEFYQYEKPDWCPLKPMPEKKDRSKVVGDYLRGRCDGYNACIDEIMKGSEENG